MDKEKKINGVIKPIGKNVVHQICSGQVILTLAIAVKELVENAIDAGANIIDIVLKEYGSELIEVSDNGSGVLEDNFQALTLKHYTSKIEDFTDLQFLETLGFRGEALSSLCALTVLTIVTKHHSSEEAKKIKYDSDGKIIEISIAARETGTTVTLENLFATLPVRRKDFIKNMKREFGKMCQVLYAYCLIPNGIKFTCSNITSKGGKNLIVSTHGSLKVRENIISVFGSKQISSLIEVELVDPDEEILNEFHIKSKNYEEIPFRAEFLISSVTHGSGRSSTDRQFFYINSRPVEPTKIIKLINQIYKQFNANQYPFVYLNIVLISSIIDVNVTPDKRQVFLEKENLILACLKKSLLDAFKVFPSTMPTQNQDISIFLRNTQKEEITFKKGLKRHSSESSKDFLNSFRKKLKSCDKNREIDTFFRSASEKITIKHDTSSSEIEDSFFEEDEETLKKIPERQNEPRNKSTESSPVKMLEPGPKDLSECSDDDFHEISTQDILNSAFDPYKNDEECSSDENQEEIVDQKRKKSIENDIHIVIDAPSENIHARKREYHKISLDLIRERLNETLDLSKTNDQITKVKFHKEISPENNREAEDELKKEISKKDFENMEIIGQFNLGFIIARMDNDLFIIDQHATDEKYNFEQLQANTVLQKQTLVNPRALNLTCENEILLMECEEIFNKNGFYFKIDKDAPGTKKIYLTTIPMSQSMVFGKDDIDEMLFMLKDSKNMCRPTRLISMFASRACRKSVMIGTKLSDKDMRKLINHMGQIEQPWNCPHGRPTIRHLINLDLLLRNDD